MKCEKRIECFVFCGVFRENTREMRKVYSRPKGFHRDGSGGTAADPNEEQEEIPKFSKGAGTCPKNPNHCSSLPTLQLSIAVYMWGYPSERGNFLFTPYPPPPNPQGYFSIN